MADIMDYWNGAGYGQIPDQNPYTPTNAYQDPAPWAGANSGYTGDTTFNIPGSSPGSAGGQAGFLAGRMGGNVLGGVGAGLGAFGPTLGPLGLLAGSALSGFQSWPFKGKFLDPFKKKKLPDLSSYNATNYPSVQGNPFMPQEGLPQYYNPSQETTNQSQQQLYAQQQAQAGQQSNDLMSSLQNALSGLGQGQGYDYNYGGGQPNYVGQQEQAYGSFYGGQGGQSGLTNTFNPSNPYGGQYQPVM